MFDSSSIPYQRPQHGESSTSPEGQLLHAGESPEYNTISYRAQVPTKATRRIRGEIACAECRRLKIKCDRTVPCSTCVKRGCGALCPNGTIPPGEGSRFVLAATDHLRRKLTRMEARMRSLEDAIAIIHGSSNEQPHPLLAFPLESDHEEEPILKPVQESDTRETSRVSDALGMLILDSGGGSRFFGPSGGSEGLLLAPKESDHNYSKFSSLPLQELDPSYLPEEINSCFQTFPLSPPGIVVPTVQSTIESFLPSMERAITLCDTFLEHLSWMFSIVSRQQLVHELIPVIYKQTLVPYGPHDLALLLIVLGIGSLVDLDLPPYNLEAQHYYRLARAAATLQPVLAEQSVVTIKVLHLMSIYNGMSGKESNLEQSYVLLDLAGQVALRIGFHLDPSLWGFGGREAYDRRVYFWNLMAGVIWQSLITGRPPGLLNSFVDCKIPSAEDENMFQQGEVPLGFGIWGFRASVECLIPVAKTTLAVRPPKYDTIMELDRKIRTFVQPSKDALSDQNDRIAISMRTFVRSHYQDLMLMFLHRGYFAQAMTEYPANPLDSPYGRSVSAAYASACVVLQDTKSQFIKKPLLCGRVWRLWSFGFSAAVIVGTLAIRGPHLNLNPPPFHEFETICEVFQSAAAISSRAARALPVLDIMLQKAIQARDYYRGKGTLLLSKLTPDDELSIFGGRTRVINDQSPQKPNIKSLTNLACSAESQKPPLSSLADLEQMVLQQAPEKPRTSTPSFTVDTDPYYPGAGASIQTPPPLTIPTIPDIPAIPTPIVPQGLSEQTTISDLTGGWDGLFDEVSRTSSLGLNVTAPPQPAGEGTMLNDRWSSFMQNYHVLEGIAPRPTEQGNQ